MLKKTTLFLILGILIISKSFAQGNYCLSKADFYLRTVLGVGPTKEDVLKSNYSTTFDIRGITFYGNINNEIKAVAIVVAEDGDCNLKALIAL